MTVSPISGAEARLARRGWLIPARVLWIGVTLLIIALVIAGVPRIFHRYVTSADIRAIHNLGWGVAGYGSYLTGLSLMVVFFHLAIGLIVFWRRSHDPIGMAVAAALVTNGAWFPLSLMYGGSDAGEFTLVLVGVITYLGLISGLTLLYVFPDGRFVPRWTLIMAFTWAVLAFFAIFFPKSPLSLTRWPILLQLFFFVFHPPMMTKG